MIYEHLQEKKIFGDHVLKISCTFTLLISNSLTIYWEEKIMVIILTFTGVEIGFLGRPATWHVPALGILLEMALLWIFESVQIVLLNILNKFLFQIWLSKME